MSPAAAAAADDDDDDDDDDVTVAVRLVLGISEFRRR